MVETYYILGAGVSGLVAGYELAKKGKRVILIEKDSEIGGIAKSFYWHDMPCDLGPHIYHTPDKDIQQYWNTEFPGLLYEREHWSKNYKEGQYCDYPLSKEYIEKLPAQLRDRIKMELMQSENSRGCAVNFYEYTRSLVGPTLHEMFFVKYPEKVWGMSTKELDANWAPKRIEIREKSTPFYWGQYAAVGNEGSGTIINALEQKIRKFGSEIKLEEEVVGIERVGGRIKRIKTTKNSYDLCPDDIVVNTMPATTLSRMFGYQSKLCYRGIILVYLYVNKKDILPREVDFIYFDDPGIIFTRLTDQSQFVKRPPMENNVYICEVPYCEGDVQDGKPAEEITAAVVEGLLKLGVVSRENILDSKVVKLPKVYPILYRDYRLELAKVMSLVDGAYNLYNIGLFAEYAYNDLQVLFSKGIDLALLLTDKTLQINRISKGQHHRLSFKTEIDIGGYKIGEGHSAFVIAEIGLNHNGNLDLAKRLIDAAIASGVQAVKLQSYKAEKRVTPSGKTSRYAEKILGVEETDYEMLKRYELTRQETEELFNYARERTVIFSTPFDLEHVDILESLGASCYKIASFDLVNFPLLRKVAITKKPIILSTGMASLSDVEDALSEIIKFNNQVVLLHCTSAYPCASENMNIRAIDTMKAAFKLPVGLSDHSIGHIVTIAAVARGAHVIEKHFTMDRHMEGPDHVVSLEPDELREMMTQIGIVEKALGDGIKQLAPNEFPILLRFRKTMYTAKDLKKGDVIREEDIVLKGPAFGIYPKFQDVVLGKRVLVDLPADSPITWDILI